MLWPAEENYRPRPFHHDSLRAWKRSPGPALTLGTSPWTPATTPQPHGPSSWARGWGDTCPGEVLSAGSLRSEPAPSSIQVTRRPIVNGQRQSIRAPLLLGPHA